jgi:chaperonin GroEL
VKIINYSHELRDKLSSGVEKLSKAVGATLGPRGRNALIREEGKPPFITKDGVTVAKHFSLEDPIENAGAEIVKQASRRTNIEAGDGTTTSTVLAVAIFKEAAIRLQEDSSLSPVQLQRSLQKLSEAVLEELAKDVKEVETLEDVRHIATIAANNDESIGDLITKAVDKVGPDGSITIENSNTSETTLDLIEGFRFDSGYASSSFITDERRRVLHFEEPLFLVTDFKLDSIDQILPTLELAARESRPLVIVAEEVEGQALAALIMNASRGNMKVAAIKAPGYGTSRRDTMQDLALSVGAKFFQRIGGDKLNQITLGDFGAAKSIRSSNTDTTIVGGEGRPEMIALKIESLKGAIADAHLQDADDLVQRLVRLQSGVAMVRVGGNSEVEVTEKRHRVEDALEAVRSAQAEGIVPGGGFSLLKCSKMLDNMSVLATLDGGTLDPALSILSAAFKEPIRCMAHNAGVGFEDVLSSFESFEGSGFDFLNIREVGLIQEGIIDPYRVTRCCIKNAVSVAASLLTTDVSIIES